MIKIILDILKEKFYRDIALIAAAIFAIANGWLLFQEGTLKDFTQMMLNGDFFSSLPGKAAVIASIAYTFAYLLMTAAIIIAFGISVALLVWLFVHSALNRKKVFGLNVAGFFTALFASGCPVCGTFLFSLIGVSGGIGIFPLKGLELKALSLGLIAGSVVLSSKKVQKIKESGCETEACKVPEEQTIISHI
jgi:hypothetical protein